MPGAAQLDEGQARGGVADVAGLFEHRAREVHRLVRHEVRAPEAVIEDACQIAWIRLVDHRERVGRDTVIAWLVTTAMHEALKLLRREQREHHLAPLLAEPRALGGGAHIAAPDEIVLQRARLEALRSLSVRQRQLVWLQGVGLSYEEMASETGATRRTVERQLTRARRKLAADGPGG
jgi:RNA polymerase sigma factor (sigma-70 family)